MYSPVLTKTDFVRRYAAGEFGNCSPTWQTVESFVGLRGKGLYHLRNREAGGQTFYNLGYYTCCQMWTDMPDWKRWYVSEMAPTERTTLQGEVQQTERGLSLYYTQVPKPMRDALKEDAHQVWGIITVTLLRQHLNSVSYDWLQVLLDRYPGHVVEFSAFSQEWGTIPGYNTTFWEVRLY